MEKNSYYGVSRADEEKKFIEVNKITENRLKELKAYTEQLTEEMNQLREVYDVEDKEGLAQWFNTDSRFKEARQDLKKAERERRKPYFGRIDFIDTQIDRKETYYVGKSGIFKTPSEPVVIDWRTPAASIYYDSSLGKVSYKVPGEGMYEVNLERKRTYEIENDNLKDFYDSDVVANDDLLTKFLAKGKKAVLSEIIATIQQEQNEVIRKDPHYNVLVQGSAGSGKTTVAMHRISYILYNYEREFKPEGFYIIGSNKVLLNYITGVLPDLDVFGVKDMPMEELFTRLLYEDWDKKKYTIKPLDKKDKRVGIKGTTEWFNKLTDYAREYATNAIPKDDVLLEKNGPVFYKGEHIVKIINEHQDDTMQSLLEILDDKLTTALEDELYGKYHSYSLEKQKNLFRHFSNYFSKTTIKESSFDIYNAFVEKMISEGMDVEYEKGNPDLYDLACLAYIYKRIREREVIQEASHVVVDEAQDFGMTCYHSLKYCMSKCTFTIMGDVAQNINLGCGLGDWEELKKIMLPDRYDFFGLLRKSYRNTIQISTFATDILKHGTFPIYPVEPIIRNGNDVRVEEKKSKKELIETVANISKEWLNEYETIAVICKDRNEAVQVAGSLPKELNAKAITGEGDIEIGSGIMVLPIEYSKGLEFDSVIIFNASKENYPKEDGYAKLLYVASTRALHELVVLHQGELTGLIKDPIPEDRKNNFMPEDTYHLKPRQFEEEFKTKQQIAKEQAIVGDEELAKRGKIGPAPIEVKTLQKEIKKVTKVESAPSTYGKSEFGTMPEGTSLQPIGHSQVDVSVRFVRKTGEELIVTSSYGTLRIKPISDDAVRIGFFVSEAMEFSPIPSELATNESVTWKCIQAKDSIEMVLKHLRISISKKTGIMTFIKPINDAVLLKEKLNPTRHCYTEKKMFIQYFDWPSKEKLSARNLTDKQWVDVTKAAKYVSHTERDLSTIIMSQNGYQLIIPSGIKTLLCDISTYGPYVKMEGGNCLEYYFQAAH